MLEQLTLARVVQSFPNPRIEDIPATVGLQMQRLQEKIRPGDSVAITAGSRGIRHIPLILKNVAQNLRDMGAEPFIVSAMGSHGGGTPDGQRQILEHLGITEETVSAPFRITSESVPVATTPSGHVLYMDAEAMKADAIFLVNRIKPHTAFRDRLASGLFKILTVGLGKGPGAAQVHRLGAPLMYPAMVEMAQTVMAKLPILGGMAIVENGNEETACIEVLLPEEMEKGEERLLRMAADLLPGLPVRELDLLIVDEMGKDFSGTGMDTNVIGRWKVQGMEEPPEPRIHRIVVLGLSAGSMGNANGIGLADFTTERLARAIDWESTLANVRTTGFWARSFCPPFLPSDREAIRWALESLAMKPGAPLRAARIHNTLHLKELWLSPGALEAASGCIQTSPFRPLSFDEQGRLIQGL